jgi:hypothetical protein
MASSRQRIEENESHLSACGGCEAEGMALAAWRRGKRRMLSARHHAMYLRNGEMKKSATGAGGAVTNEIWQLLCMWRARRRSAAA